VDLLVSDLSKSNNVLGWKPSITFSGLVEMMMKEYLKQLGK